jgi:hypothetical protein
MSTALPGMLPGTMPPTSAQCSRTAGKKINSSPWKTG